MFWNTNISSAIDFQFCFKIWQEDLKLNSMHGLSVFAGNYWNYDYNRSILGEN